jgi:hypothetical protein
VNLDRIPEFGSEGFAQAAIGAPETGKIVFVLVIENEDALPYLCRRIRRNCRCCAHGKYADS